MTRISETDVLCFDCKWRNSGRSDECENCSKHLISHRPLQGPSLSEWVELQMKQRNELGIETGVEDLKVLRQWASDHLDETSRPSLTSFGATAGKPVVRAAAPVPAEPSLVRAVCPSCHAEYHEGVKFCSECGAATEEPAAAVQVAQLELALEQMSDRVRRLEGRAVSEHSQARFNWLQVPNDQKWKVTWGVFGRTILINLVIWAGIMLLFLALGLIAAVGQ